MGLAGLRNSRRSVWLELSNEGDGKGMKSQSGLGGRLGHGEGACGSCLGSGFSSEYKEKPWRQGAERVLES